jgi:hypothetical protein
MTHHHYRQILKGACLIEVVREMALVFAVVLTTDFSKGDFVLGRVGNSCCRRTESVGRGIRSVLIGNLNCIVWATKMDWIVWKTPLVEGEAEQPFSVLECGGWEWRRTAEVPGTATAAAPVVFAAAVAVAGGV